MNQAKNFAKYLGLFLARFVLFPIYFLSGFSSRRDDLWVFGSWGGYRFADNAAAFFLFCHKQIGDRVRLVWISRSKDIIEDVRERGYEAHWLWSLRGLCCCLRAKFYLFDSFSKDVNYWPSRQAIKINLWSGVPLKTFERDIDNPRSRYFRLFHGSLPERWFLGMMMPWHVDRPDLLIATSDETREITWKAFDVTSDSVVVTGLPRNDILFARSRAAGKAQRAWPDSFSAAVDAKRFIFFYLPTYRDSGKAFLNIAWEEVDSLMCHLGATFFFKFHPDDKGRFEGELENVVQLPQKIDIYEMLAYADALVSDYSSIIFDYMLLDRPIIYYVPDLDDFVASSRSLYFHPADIAVGPMCTTTSELMTSLIEAAERRKMPETVRAQWDEKRRRFNTHHDGESSRRTLEAIKERYFFGNI